MLYAMFYDTSLCNKIYSSQTHASMWNEEKIFRTVSGRRRQRYMRWKRASDMFNLWYQSLGHKSVSLKICTSTINHRVSVVVAVVQNASHFIACSICVIYYATPNHLYVYIRRDFDTKSNQSLLYVIYTQLNYIYPPLYWAHTARRRRRRRSDASSCFMTVFYVLYLCTSSPYTRIRFYMLCCC